ncbi:MAG TPA: hypothetical protein PLA68_15355 [Panacibacter sp.]|nr:hypothetical protein [Panacibacter sp.]
MVNSTLEDLVLYMHKELAAAKRAEVESELEQNWALKEKYNVLLESFNRINNIKLQSPRMQTVNAIMQYAGGIAKVSS